MIKLVVTLVAALCCSIAAMSCKKAGTEALSSVSSKTQPSPTNDDPSAYDPVCCSPYTSDGLKKAWDGFRQNGRFKVARDHSYEYIWADLGYDFDGSFKHLAVLVTDSMKSGPGHYGVVIFSAPDGGNGSYKQYWLHAIQTDAETEIRRASGYLFVDGCSVRWSRSKAEYVCS